MAASLTSCRRSASPPCACQRGGDLRAAPPPGRRRCRSRDRARRRVGSARPSAMPSSSRSDGVHARDHVLDDLRRRVPDAELLAQLGVERFQERLVEILHGVVRPRSGRRRRRDRRAIERHRRSSPAPPTGSQAFEGAGLASSLKGPHDRHVQILRPPFASRRRFPESVLCLRVPEHPGREDAVEERLHQGRAEEVLALGRHRSAGPGLLPGRVRTLARAGNGAFHAQARRRGHRRRGTRRRPGVSVRGAAWRRMQLEVSINRSPCCSAACSG